MKNNRSLYNALLIAAGLLLVLGSIFYLFGWNKPHQTKLTLKSSNGLPPFFDLKSVKRAKTPEKFTIRIPTLGVDEPVYEGIGAETLALGVGHYPGTASPGENGNIVLAGHSIATDEHPGPFSRVDELKPGDQIILLDAAGKQFDFIVSEQKVVASTDMSVVDPTEKPTVTLISCIKPDYPRDKRLITTAAQKQ